MDAIARHERGPVAGSLTLSLGRVPEPGGWRPAYCCIVPGDLQLAIGQTLPRLPVTAVPVQVFFPDS